ncbi:DUF4919 domain-containing protein [Nocardioides limicola]|uniref:DUF4919 domain-containing protein n=1 Tax=Nocardioides limicola TaxID=2803368 RepID=UPI00193B811E|nr:DUF4919 domain-containing protein [Nocardioides sp. DJM-14]
MTTLRDLVRDYQAAPDPSSLSRLRSAVRASPNFQRDLVPAKVVAPLLEAGAYPELIETLQRLMPGAFFSPAVHAALAEAHRRTGDDNAAQREAGLAQAALQSILSSGDGSAESPWSVLRLSDEYDVLQALGRQPTGQRLIDVGGRRVDRHDCTDGTSYHFDVTELW